VYGLSQQLNKSNGSLVIAIRPEAKLGLCAQPSYVLVLRFTMNLPNKSYILLNICYHTLFQDPALSGASVALTSPVRAPAMLLQLIVGN
jgi:hypothetical protein